ncbi:hypothetical protein O181_034462 [Austropuccinia psidii MF-1]|uniref:Uncharacterized protein n=1 Tax=Austropuccinia psidii MF-1 TaxID=1389203 RepID=A0A9Q3D6M8_9BASI|nr:hypothetical protein [Austropuccinia psidii MF-1]
MRLTFIPGPVLWHQQEMCDTHLITLLKNSVLPAFTVGAVGTGMQAIPTPEASLITAHARPHKLPFNQKGQELQTKACRLYWDPNINASVELRFRLLSIFLPTRFRLIPVHPFTCLGISVLVFHRLKLVHYHLTDEDT